MKLWNVGMTRLLAVIGLCLCAALPAAAQQNDPQNTVYLQTKDVAQIKALTKRGFYDGIVFHRVIPGFMAQTGDPTGTGTGGSDLPNIPAEFTQEPFKRGSVGMARSSSPNSANSQFFICYEGCGSLTGQYTLFGEVVAGMDVVDKIKKGNQGNNGQVSGPDKIVKMQLAADAR
jgi:cyclophilin family peptidyl-prolyl cis-trans isomerase